MSEFTVEVTDLPKVSEDYPPTALKAQLVTLLQGVIEETGPQIEDLNTEVTDIPYREIVDVTVATKSMKTLYHINEIQEEMQNAIKTDIRLQRAQEEDRADLVWELSQQK